MWETSFIRGGRDARDTMALKGPTTQLVDLKGRRVLPGLIDSHLHIICGGLNFNMELRWDAVRSLRASFSLHFPPRQKLRPPLGG
jgi:predicted amidohydrolase YtcJ